MMTGETLSRVKLELRFVRSIAVLPHIHADGDALGASFAFAALMREEQKEVTVILEEAPSRNLVSLCDEFVLWDDPRIHGAVFDMAVALDCGDEKRLGQRMPLFEAAGQTVCIDHHMTNEGFAELNVIEENASSTSELICDLYKEYDRPPLPRAAEQLYAGLITDTGSFRFSNATAKALAYAATMVRLGADVAALCSEIYETVSPAALKLKARALSALTFYGKNADVAGIVLTAKDFEETGANEFDAEGFAGLARSVEGVEAAFYIQVTDKIKVSLRAGSRVNVAQVARRYDGGGHARAAGFALPLGMDVKALAKELAEAISPGGQRR